jgi:DNA-binding GntR family transcriptional regulator
MDDRMCGLSYYFDRVPKQRRISETLFLAIKAAIIHGFYPGGTRLPELAIADELLLSRTTIRETIQLLAGEGYLVYQKGAGYIVAEITLTDAAKLYEMLSVETKIALTAFPIQADLVQMAYLEMMARKETQSCFERDKNFHWMIAFFSNNRQIMFAVSEILDRLSWAYHTLSLRDISAGVVSHHDEIIQAILAGPGDVESCVDAHFQKHMADLAVLA